MSEPEARMHNWRQKPTNSTEYFVYYCPVCGLEYSRKASDRKVVATDEWKMTVPCIEPVPERVSQAVLLQDLKDHGIRESCVAIGLPGDWRVGFYLRSSKGVAAYPSFKVADLEIGFALLLRWVRSRNYKLENDHHYTYLKKLYDTPYCWEHDD